MVFRETWTGRWQEFEKVGIRLVDDAITLDEIRAMGEVLDKLLAMTFQKLVDKRGYVG